MGNAVISGQMKVGTLVKTTFRSISGGRYRCNQTGKVLGKGALETYRRVRQNGRRVKPKPVKLTASMDYWGDVNCPHCSTSRYLGSRAGEQDVECNGCGKTFRAIKQAG